MKMRLNWQSLFLILLTTAFAALYSWIEYFILVGVVQEVIYTKILFWIAYLVVAFAFTTINSYAGFACFASGALTEDFLYRFFSQTNYLDTKLMVGALIVVAILVARSMIIIDSDEQKFEIVQEGPSILEGKEAETFIEDIKKPPTPQQIETVERVQQEFKPQEPQVEVKVSEEEEFDPKKEEMKKRVKERFLKKQREKYNGK